MTRVFRAEPGRVASFAPGRGHVILTRPGHVSRHAEPSEVMRTNVDVSHAPIEKLPARFFDVMKAKGWLKDKCR